MPFEPVSQQSAPEIVFDQIVEGVLSGDLPAGEALPSERELARILGVSRPTVREALKRVAAAGLVSIRQGDGARVQDIARTGGLDLLPRLLIRGGALVPSVARSIVEARAAVGPDVAGLAAKRATSDHIERLSLVLADVAVEPDPVAHQVVALEFWSTVVDAADSIAFRLMYNSLRAAYEPAVPALASMLEPEVGNIEGYRAVVDAIGTHDPERAATAARELLAPATASLLDLCRALEDAESVPGEES
ncbi:FadR/GntR family transcriptional regulator [Gordonia terrae]|uniref:FadR family transcriptional regulator n=2 Tax=Gordonia terrae TaxID=2055 RepID=A0AAD0KGG9_9ACTN|nr:FadR/GntR family transcriptional regulator [Gordonia terrae]ANY25315.1 GntR family transcriptional regulator [Gordonia terrae]AWO86066.1 FadR family transcriptional regulator [Gordonia terrae]VTR08214.1 GntR family transcriptional regulator [Clostridioides difficile]VTS62730.1 Fatty acid metabolism regulator protein [Gordonia terrae]